MSDPTIRVAALASIRTLAHPTTPESAILALTDRAGVTSYFALAASELQALGRQLIADGTLLSTSPNGPKSS